MKTTKDIYKEFVDHAKVRNTCPRTLELQCVQFECDDTYIIPNFASAEYDDKWYLNYYEPRIMSNHIIEAKTHRFISQYEYVISKLTSDECTRQAMLIMTSESEYSRDGLMMCLVSMQYLLDGDELKTFITMRSSDIYRFHQDLIWQLKIRDKIAADISAKLNKNITCANIVWNVGSLHLYERYWNLLQKN